MKKLRHPVECFEYFCLDTLSLLLLRVTFTRKLNSWDVTNYNILKPTGRRAGALGTGKGREVRVVR